jgi:hypothetical protein
VSAPTHAPRACFECGFTPKQADGDSFSLRYCRRHRISVKATATPCAFAKPRKEPKPDQEAML